MGKQNKRQQKSQKVMPLLHLLPLFFKSSHSPGGLLSSLSCMLGYWPGKPDQQVWITSPRELLM